MSSTSNRQFGDAVYVKYEKTRKREYYNINRDSRTNATTPTSS
jgi:hypothetical protein